MLMLGKEWVFFGPFVIQMGPRRERRPGDHRMVRLVHRGQASDYKGYEPLRLEPGPEPNVLIADKGFDSGGLREVLITRKTEPVITMHRNRKAQDPIDSAT